MNERKDFYPIYGVSYVSCMKLNGVPLLPPLMTPEYRQEMQYYKQLAMAVERRINDLKFCLDETTINSNILQSDSEEWPDGANVSIISSRSDQINDLTDYGSFDYLNNMKPNHVENNNDFESMNSQLTVIVNNDEFAANITTSSPIVKDSNESVTKMDTSSLQIDIKLDEGDKKSSLFKNSCVQLDNNSNVPNKSTHEQKDTTTVKDVNFNNSRQTSSDNLDVAKNVIKTSTKPISGTENPKSDNSSSKPNKKTVTSKTCSAKDKKNVSNKKDNVLNSKSTPVSAKKTILSSRDLTNLKKLPNSSTVVSTNKLSPSKNVTGSLNNISSGLSSPPKLVRQKSYTLEYPSPLLLAHLEVQSLASGIEVQSISMSESTSIGHLSNVKEKSSDSTTAKEIWSSLGSDMNSLSFNETSGVHSVNEKKPSSDKKITSELEKKSEVTPNKKNKNVQSSTNTINKTSSAIDDKTKQLQARDVSPQSSEKLNSSIVSNISDVSQMTSPLPIDLSKCSDSTSASVCLKYILKKFEEDHAKKLVDLIKKQKEEQIQLQKVFESQHKMILSQFQTAYKKNICENLSDDGLVNSSKTDKSSLIGISGRNTSNTKSDKMSDNISNSESFSYPKSSHKSDNKSQSDDDVDKYLQITENILHKSRSIRNQMSLTDSPIKNVNHVQKNDVKVPISDHQTKKPSEEVKSLKQINNKNVEDICAQKDKNSMYDDDNIFTERSANTLDDVNTTFTSDDTSEGKYSSLSNSNVSVRDMDGTSKLKSAMEKITKIQQNLASQPPIRFSQNVNMDRTYHQDDFGNHQSVSLSLISSMSNSFTEQENHYSLPDRNTLSLNLIDVNRPQSNRNQGFRMKSSIVTEREIRAATIIVAYAKGFLTRRLMRTEKVESIVQTIKDTLLCAIQLHKDEKGIQGADVDLHRRLIQQITAACYTLHDTFIISTADERMRIITQDRERKRALMHRSASSVSSSKQLSATTQKILKRKLEGMSKSHSGVFTNRTNRHHSTNVMTRSHYDAGDHFRAALNYRPKRSITVTGEHGGSRRPWR